MWNRTNDGGYMKDSTITTQDSPVDSPVEQKIEPAGFWTVFWAALLFAAPLALCCYLLLRSG